MAGKKKKIFAAASNGGHWVQLLRLSRPLEERYEVMYASTHPKCASMIGGRQFFLMSDFNRNDAWRMVPSFFRLLRVLWSEHPDAVITTGAAPGLACVLAGWMLRRKTIWIDSIANVEHLSASGRIARRFASRTYTQWPEAVLPGVVFAGTVLGEKKEE